MQRLISAVFVWLLSACAIAPVSETLRLNDVQMVGSHNSYRRMGDAAAMAAIEAARQGLSAGLAYDHQGLSAQLELGVRQIELDVFSDPVGGAYRKGDAPGFKVMHLPGLDDRSSCVTLQLCLAELRVWSEAHPGHLPIVITIDAKDQPFAIPGVTTPVPLTPALLEALDLELLDGLGRGRVITPNEVRGAYPSLRAAVRANAWPTLDAARGRFLVIFDVRAATAELYRQGHGSLAGRTMFSLYDASEDEAATFIVQDPRGAEEARIRDLVRDGFFVRTRSDAGTIEARRRDRSKLEAAVASGAQIVSTDYYPGAPDPLGLGFVVTLPGDTLWRCNPVRRRPSCRVSSGAE